MEIEAIIKCTKGNPSPYQLFPDMPSVTAWPQRFENNLLWYSLLIVQGPSASGASKCPSGPDSAIDSRLPPLPALNVAVWHPETAQTELSHAGSGLVGTLGDLRDRPRLAEDAALHQLEHARLPDKPLHLHREVKVHQDLRIEGAFLGTALGPRGCLLNSREDAQTALQDASCLAPAHSSA